MELHVSPLRARYEYYNRSGGRDHVFCAVGDKGGCGLGTAGVNHILLTHLGWPASNELWKETPTRREVMQPSLFDNAAALRRAQASGSACFAPHKDVVVPPTAAHSLRPKEWAFVAEADPARDWEHGLVHGGGIWGWKNFGPRAITSYSLGMRQALHLRFGEQQGREGISISNASRGVAWTRSKFCLSTVGHGWGMRTAKSALLNCLPLVAQPYVTQPWEQLVNYSRFSLRLNSMREVEGTEALLRSVQAPQVESMRRALKRLAPAFACSSMYK